LQRELQGFDVGIFQDAFGSAGFGDLDHAATKLFGSDRVLSRNQPDDGI
jgi:hypothetical protein